MRHLKSGRKLGRNASHRAAMMRNLAASLIAHERVVTTVAKAKEARKFVERLITVAKRGGLHARRLVLSRLGGKRIVDIPDDADKDKKKTIPVKVVPKLFDVLVPRYKDRKGGYTRILKRSYVRLGDAGPTAFLELIKEGDTAVAKPTAPKVSAPAEKPAESSKEEKSEE
jgi:large subunit ribosomal protein L17